MQIVQTKQCLILKHSMPRSGERQTIVMQTVIKREEGKTINTLFFPAATMRAKIFLLPIITKSLQKTFASTTQYIAINKFIASKTLGLFTQLRGISHHGLSLPLHKSHFHWSCQSIYQYQNFHCGLCSPMHKSPRRYYYHRLHQYQGFRRGLCSPVYEESRLYHCYCFNQYQSFSATRH